MKKPIDKPGRMISRTIDQMDSRKITKGERERLKRSAALIAGAVFMFSFALLGVAAWIVVFFWDTHRLEAIAAVTLTFALVGAFLLWRNTTLSRESPTPFSATLAELAKDRTWLAGGSEHRSVE